MLVGPTAKIPTYFESAALLEHAHLIPRPGCFQRCKDAKKGKKFADTRPNGQNIETPLPGYASKME